MNKKLTKIFGRNQKKRRKDLGLTLKQLGEEVNVTNAFLSRVESGKNAPSLDVAHRIATALGTTINDLLEEGEKSDKKT